MNKGHTMMSAGLIPLDANVEVVHRDRYGNIKAIFQENRLCRFLLKHGVISPSVMKIPFLLGMWSTSKVFKNLVVDAGKAGAASRINGSGGEAVFDRIGAGTGATAPAAGDTALGAEKDEAGGATTTHKSATVSRVTTTVTNDTAQDVVTFNYTASVAVTESGVFNAATAGTMLCRQTFTAVNVVNGDSLQFTWKIKSA
jgi:hypothetical protein